MYSIVFAAMLTSGTPAPAFGGLFSSGGESCFGGCQGCSGCTGYSCMGCNGCGGCSGCCGGCNGCNGYGFLGIRDFFHNAFSMGGGCNGCCGGCNGCCGGCNGGCNGCFGSMSCFGGSGCCGGYSGYSMADFGMSSSGYVVPMGMFNSMPMDNFGSTPMMGSMPMMGSTPYAMPMVPQGNVMTPTPPLNMPNQMPYGSPPQAADATMSPNQATVVVSLPADARLYVEKELMNLTGSVRAFRTTDLAPGAKYTYTIRMEVERGGKIIDKTEVINLEPGKRTQVFFPDPSEGAGSTAKLAYTPFAR
jgi:uncharacterized protein (TIGR03000 family)